MDWTQSLVIIGSTWLSAAAIIFFGSRFLDAERKRSADNWKAENRNGKKKGK
jgi:hypothetical protein